MFGLSARQKKKGGFSMRLSVLDIKFDSHTQSNPVVFLELRQRFQKLKMFNACLNKGHKISLVFQQTKKKEGGLV